MSEHLPFALYDCFSDSPFGGSQAAVVSNAAGLSADIRERIARELGLPATAFVAACNNHEIDVRFLSTVMELPMCGHGTLGLVTRMVELGELNQTPDQPLNVTLNLPAGPASLTVAPRDDGRPMIMLEVQPPAFRSDKVDAGRLCGLFGLTPADISDVLPVETASADFIHLVVPLRGLAQMRCITPDFAGMVKLCHDHGLETIVVICTETERPHSTVHVRDFCPAVGVSESAAAGTTNAAVSSYLLRHGVVSTDAAGKVGLQAEQGIELNRPSEIHTEITMSNDTISTLKVGGVATKVAEGTLIVPAN